MQTIRFRYMITLLTSLVLMATGCSSGGGDDPAPTPVPSTGRHLTQTCNMEPHASQVTVTLTGLTAAVTRHTGSNAWVIVVPKTYTSGAPQVTVSVAENATSDSRSQELTFYAATDTLVLTVRQAAFDAGGGTSMDNPFDTPSDQPAFARER